jgi:hypothetical protein
VEEGCKWKNGRTSSAWPFGGARQKRAPARRLAKLRGRLEERYERGQPHGRLAEVHSGLAELSGRGRRRCTVVWQS